MSTQRSSTVSSASARSSSRSSPDSSRRSPARSEREPVRARGVRALIATVSLLAGANAAWAGVLYGDRSIGSDEGAAGIDVMLLGVLGSAAVIAGIHVIRSFSSQDPPPAGETRLLAWMLVAVHGTLLVLKIAGALDSPQSSEEIEAARHAIGIFFGATLLMLATWLAARQQRATQS